jgi:hypothetical protein
MTCSTPPEFLHLHFAQHSCGFLAFHQTPFSPDNDIRNVVSTLPFFYYRDRVRSFITARGKSSVCKHGVNR